MDRPAKKPSPAQPGERPRQDDDRGAVGMGDDDLTDDEIDELEDEEGFEDEGEDDEA